MHSISQLKAIVLCCAICAGGRQRGRVLRTRRGGVALPPPAERAPVPPVGGTACTDGGERRPPQAAEAAGPIRDDRAIRVEGVLHEVSLAIQTLICMVSTLGIQVACQTGCRLHTTKLLQYYIHPPHTSMHTIIAVYHHWIKQSIECCSQHNAMEAMCQSQRLLQLTKSTKTHGSCHGINVHC